MFDYAQKQRYARQLLLAEIGEQGQARLCASSIGLPADAEPHASAIAREYLARGGMQHTTDTGVAAGVANIEVRVPGAEAIAALAGAPELEPAAAALAGAFAAVETIKAALGIGRQAVLDPTLSLSRGATR